MKTSNSKKITASVATILAYRFFKELMHLPFIKKIFLYGSRAKGINDVRSDIDLAIECPTASAVDWNKVMEIIEKADTLLKIDCVRFDTIESAKLKDSIRENHIILFAR
jgi:predicted nucleotidyltransferase